MNSNALTYSEARQIAVQYSYLRGKPTPEPGTTAIKFVTVAPYFEKSLELFARNVIELKISPSEALADLGLAGTVFTVALLAERIGQNDQVYYVDLFSYLLQSGLPE